MKRLIANLFMRQPRESSYHARAMCRVPEVPVGFVSRSDPNFYFLSRKF